MPQSPTHYLPIAVVDHHTAPPPPDIIALELYLVACPSRPLDIGTYVHVYHVPEPDACSYFPTALSPRPLRIATRLRGRLVGACLNPGNKIVFEMETWNDESQIRLAHLHVDAYPGLTVDRGRWCSLAVAQLRRRLFVSICSSAWTRLTSCGVAGIWMQVPGESVSEEARRHPDERPDQYGCRGEMGRHVPSLGD